MAVMQMLRSNLFAYQENQVGPQQEQALASIIQRRLTREPLAYILGRKEFYGISLLVTPSVLIPRPETEQLVEQALFQALMTRESADLVIADVGTGSGAIAINLAIHLPAARIYAIDQFDSALDVAAYNRSIISDPAVRLVSRFDPVERVATDLRILTNLDFGTVRGLDVRLDRRFGNWLNGTIAYAYQDGRSTGWPCR